MNSDILSAHVYEPSEAVMPARYADEAARRARFAGMGPARRRILVDGVADAGQPVMLTELGGIKFTLTGYSASSPIENADA